MADNIILSSSVRNNLLSLQNTARLLETTQNHLATGLKVNSALDDPSAFFTASSLNSRANDLNRLLDDVGLAVQTLEAADKGIGAITDLVEAAQATARNALQASAAVTTNASTTGTIGVQISDIAATTTGTGASISADAAATTTSTVARRVRLGRPRRQPFPSVAPKP
jgi:flagellin